MVWVPPVTTGTSSSPNLLSNVEVVPVKVDPGPGWTPAPNAGPPNPGCWNPNPGAKQRDN